MRWLLHGNVRGACAEALARHGHKTFAPPELAIDSSATPAELFKFAKAKQLDIMTSDPALVNALFESEVAAPRDRVVVFLQLAGDEVEQSDAVERLFARYKRLSPGRLYTVTRARVKVRQLPLNPEP